MLDFINPNFAPDPCILHNACVAFGKKLKYIKTGLFIKTDRRKRPKSINITFIF